MRLLVASPPKTGNVWYEHLVSVAFGLEWIRTAPIFDYWNSGNLCGLESFIAAGQYPEFSVCHQHFWPTADLFSLAKRSGIEFVTTLRHPFDQFVSWYWYIQRFPEAFISVDDPGAVAIGKPIDDPVVLGLLASHFGRFIEQGVQWLESGRSLIVRYEEMHDDPVEVLARTSRRLHIKPLVDATDAIVRSRPDAMRALSADLNLHIRTGIVGDWRNHLTDHHLAIFRTRHRAHIERLGYSLD
jgi:hypothetical protein